MERRFGMERQEAFTMMVLHLRQQGCKSMDDDNECTFRSGSYSCAIGCLIPDDIYDTGMEGSPFGTLDYFQGLSDSDWRMLNAVQRVHDHFEVDDWGLMLRKVAKQYNLELPEVEL